jgi:hypothetical protein
LICQIISGDKYKLWGAHCATFSIVPLLHPLRSKYSPEHPVLKHP